MVGGEVVARMSLIKVVAVAAAAAPSGAIHAKASKLRSRSRALNLFAVAAAAATFGVIYTKASESEASRERSTTGARCLEV